MAPRSHPGGEPDIEANEEADLRSRTDARREQREVEDALMRLSRRLVELPRKTLARLDLAENVRDVVERARLVRDPSPKTRAVRLVRIALRDADVETIERRLAEVHEAPRGTGAGDELGRFRDTLVSGGEEALNEFVTRHPDADRQKLRNLVRNVRRANDASRAKALAALTDALRDCVS